jgi:hypothetical protein
MEEEYCWAITQAAERLRYGRSGFNVFQFESQVDSPVYTYIVDHMLTQFRVVQKFELGRIFRNVTIG